jgi:BirA family biotin operon repressor/biotin-[acetyl-CoA-carboxylase] ligase
VEIREFETLESTNIYCGLLDLGKVEEFTVIWAHKQTAGIGQRGNKWESEQGKNLTFSIVLHPVFLSAGDQYRLTKTLALGVSDWLQRQGVEATIKWPNDIYVERRKICGILTENRISATYESAICGIGLNINQSLFPKELSAAVSLSQLTGKEYALRQSLEEIVGAISHRYDQLHKTPETIDDDYIARLLNLGKRAIYLYRGEEIGATIEGVNQFGHLQLVTEKGEHIECAMKEIELLLK